MLGKLAKTIAVTAFAGGSVLAQRRYRVSGPILVREGRQPVRSGDSWGVDDQRLRCLRVFTLLDQLVSEGGLEPPRPLKGTSTSS